jgi:hypothetical protein
VIGRRRGKQKERWIRDKTWQRIDERKFASQKRDHANSAARKKKDQRRITGR